MPDFTSSNNKKVRYLKYFVIALLAFIFGQAIAETPKTVYKDKPVETVKTVSTNVTPQSCKNIIEMDNEIFKMTGEMLGNLSPASLNEMATYLNETTPKRNALIVQCYSNV